jgi:hypothetical protein
MAGCPGHHRGGRCRCQGRGCVGSEPGPAGDEGRQAPGHDGSAPAGPSRGKGRDGGHGPGSGSGRQVEARPAETDGRREQESGEIIRETAEATAPVADRRLGTPEGRRDPAHPFPGRAALQGLPDDVDRVPAVRGHEPGQESIGPSAASAAHPGHEDPEQVVGAQVAQIPRPGSCRSTAARTGHPRRVDLTASCRVRADIERARPYDQARWTLSPPSTLRGLTSSGGSPGSAGPHHRAARHPLSPSPFSAAVTSRFMPIESCRQQPDASTCARLSRMSRLTSHLSGVTYVLNSDTVPATTTAQHPAAGSSGRSCRFRARLAWPGSARTAPQQVSRARHPTAGLLRTPYSRDGMPGARTGVRRVGGYTPNLTSAERRRRD